MLFAYQYLTHSMDVMQEYIQFIVEEVWCQAASDQNYDIDMLFTKNSDLKDLITDLHYQETKYADQFLKPLQVIFELFKAMNAGQKQRFKEWFCLNNDIQKLCQQGDQCHPATYSVIEDEFPETAFPKLVSELKGFFKNLYSHSFLNSTPVKSRIGDIKDHNDQFTQLNSKDVCPFCGLSGMLSHFDSKREAYDHYFPKDKYPFNSINFKNLVPACPRCNSSYKLAKDPHYNSTDPLQTPRKVFYPFANPSSKIEIEIDITQKNWDDLHPDDINITFGPDVVAQEIDTWRDIYGIDERYKSTCCSKGAGKAWLIEVFDEWKSLCGEPNNYLQRLEVNCNRDCYVEKRFLKKAFLEGCERAGLFDEMPATAS